MKTVSDLLRQADPLDDDLQRLEEGRDQIRRTVIATASVVQPVSQALAPGRRVLLTAAALIAALIVIGLLVDSNRATVQAAVRFEVRLAETQPVAGLLVARVVDSGRTIYLHPEMIVTNDDIAQSWVVQDGPDRFGISVELLEAGAQRMRQASAAHLGRPVAILIDGEVVAAPVVRAVISNSAMISGEFTRAEAERIAEGIAR
jgi:SecD-like export protein